LYFQDALLSLVSKVKRSNFQHPTLLNSTIHLYELCDSNQGLAVSLIALLCTPKPRGLKPRHSQCPKPVIVGISDHENASTSLMVVIQVIQAMA
jgi:hypothetical protein